MKTTTITRVLAIMLAAFTLGACVSPPPAVISDIEMDKVVVQSGWTTNETDIVAEAWRGCASHGRVPVSISSGCVHCLLREHLFACVEE